MITERYKLVDYYGSGEEKTDLFDSEKDPLELRSYFGDKEYVTVQADLEARLKRLRGELQVPEKDDPMATGERGRKPGAKGKQAGAAKKPAEGIK